jgi:hypothetical protein
MVDEEVQNPTDDIDLKIDSVHITKDTLDVQMSGDIAQQFMQFFVQFYESCGGENFVTFSVNSDEKAYAITIVNLQGNKSPADRIKELEAKVAELESDIKDLLMILKNTESEKQKSFSEDVKKETFFDETSDVWNQWDSQNKKKVIRGGNINWNDY